MRLEKGLSGKTILTSGDPVSQLTAQVQALSGMVSQGLAEWLDLDISCNSVDAFQGH